MTIKENFLTKILYGIVMAGIAILTAVLILLPKIMPVIFKNSVFYSIVDHGKLLILLYITGMLAWIILIVTTKICRNIINRDPFSESSITSLKIISICSCGVFLCYLYICIFMAVTLGVFTITIGAFMISLISAILYKLVKLALEIKKENELTI